MSEGTIIRVGPIALTADEHTTLSGIGFDVGTLGGHEAVVKNGEAACALMKALFARGAIPEARREWFLDPEYNIGRRGLSRKQIFERNGTCGDDIFRHPHFLPYLWYFLNGARLPTIAIEAFCEKVAECGHVTSGDVVPLGKFARQQTRTYRLEAREAAEEFYKLALDCRIWPTYARSIRNAVLRLR